MVILKSLKKQFNQFVAPEIEALTEAKINLYGDVQQAAYKHDGEDASLKTQEVKPTTIHSKLGMSKVKKASVSNSAEVNAFNELQKNAYSHGLEQIYSLETIDIRTLKTIGTHAEEVVEDEEPSNEERVVIESSQLDFDLGGEYRSHIESFTLNEPIHVLNLSPPALKCLRQQGKCVIRDLIFENWNALAVTRGMGQGHIEEIKQKLQAYTKKKSLSCCQSVDFEAWLRCILPEENHAKHHVLLSNYNLSGMISLNPAENVEVRMLPSDKKQAWMMESLEEFTSQDRKEFCLASMVTICDTFIKPWLRGRHGFGKGYELIDRLESVSVNSERMHDVMRFLQDTFYESVFPLRTLLPVVGERLFFVDLDVLDTFVLVEKMALTYFYNKEVEYSITELVTWMSKEFALKWKGFAEGFIEKVLRASEKFRTRKGDSDTLIVALA